MKYLLPLVLLVACSESQEPGQQMALAKAAGERAEHARALELYEELLGRTGEEAASEDERFQASLAAVHCLIGLDRDDEAVARYLGMAEIFPVRMTEQDAYRHTLRVLDALSPKQSDVEQLMALLAHASRAHPQHVGAFNSYVLRLISSDDFVDWRGGRRVTIDSRHDESGGFLRDTWPDAWLFPDEQPVEPAPDGGER